MKTSVSNSFGQTHSYFLLFRSAPSSWGGGDLHVLSAGVGLLGQCHCLTSLASAEMSSTPTGLKHHLLAVLYLQLLTVVMVKVNVLFLTMALLVT